MIILDARADYGKRMLREVAIVACWTIWRGIRMRLFSMGRGLTVHEMVEGYLYRNRNFCLLDFI